MEGGVSIVTIITLKNPIRIKKNYFKFRRWGGAEAPSTHGYATAPRHLCLVISITKTRI